jgi:hypothetical protein
MSYKLGLYIYIRNSIKVDAMKQILPILTLTTLTAAAFADAGAAAPAAASGLSYNTISLTYVRSTPTSGPSSKDYVLQATALIGNSNFLVVGNSNVGGDAGNGSDRVGLGYVFKNVVAGADATVLVRSNETYGVRVRKEIGSGFEAHTSTFGVLELVTMLPKTSQSI